MEKCIYTVSIALQLAGAILLIIKFWSGSAKRQLAKIQKKRTHIENTTLIIGDSGPNDREYIEELCLNRTAFIYLAAGYIIGIWGDLADANKWIIALLIIIEAGIFVGIGKIISWKWGKLIRTEVQDSENKAR